MVWIMIHSTLNRSLVPEGERKMRIATAAEYLASIKELGPAVFLIACVLGSMYGGLATPSEAAGARAPGPPFRAAPAGHAAGLSPPARRTRARPHPPPYA